MIFYIYYLKVILRLLPEKIRAELDNIGPYLDSKGYEGYYTHFKKNMTEGWITTIRARAR
ncbi:MAG: hypothetical protein QM758_04450 [Armatimonas sp.]